MSARVSRVSSYIILSTVSLASCLQRTDEGQIDQASAELGDSDDAGPSSEGPLPSTPSDTAAQDATNDPAAPLEEGGSGPDDVGAGACPPNTVEVRGEFCPVVVQECLRWIDRDHTNRAGVVDPNMCAEFRFPSTCASAQKVPMHFCVDRYEWPNVPGAVPATQMSWVEAGANCEAAGKRLCTDDEWTFACEGPSMKPYPYGDGYHRDSSACNIDRKPWIDPWVHSFAEVDKRTPSGSHKQCRSDWGVHDMVGNVDEWVINRAGSVHHEPWISGLMGGHWVYGVRNRCRAITDSHEPMFTFYVTGARCCSDPR